MLKSIFNTTLRPRASVSATRAVTQATSTMTPCASTFQTQRPATIDTVRTLLKTHKGAAKRWRKMGNGGYKRVRFLTCIL